jgi:hypothetical protein
LANVIPISPITSIEDRIYNINILIGSPQILVKQRELVKVYETNRDIRLWSSWFLLKALTTSGKICGWRGQIEHICRWLQIEASTLDRRINKLAVIGLLTKSGDRKDLHLASYEAAAKILNIGYTGIMSVPYNPTKNAGKQVFQYIIRSEEIRANQARQLSAMHYYLDKNPLLKSCLLILLDKYGGDMKMLQNDKLYFQQQLFRLQCISFKERSEILGIVFAHRADINRGVRKIKQDHNYVCPTSVSYMKKKMCALDIIAVTKKAIESKQRNRLYIPVGDTDRDGYKWNRRKQTTVLVLTDQISFCYELPQTKKTG